MHQPREVVLVVLAHVGPQDLEQPRVAAVLLVAVEHLPDVVVVGHRLGLCAAHLDDPESARAAGDGLEDVPVAPAQASRLGDALEPQHQPPVRRLPGLLDALAEPHRAEQPEHHAPHVAQLLALQLAVAVRQAAERHALAAAGQFAHHDAALGVAQCGVVRVLGGDEAVRAADRHQLQQLLAVALAPPLAAPRALGQPERVSDRSLVRQGQQRRAAARAAQGRPRGVLIPPGT